ncbi:conserved hypothetical protein [Burkholderia cenocepacia]|nr:conserved hypothetical protein [Burkholderia cenocepacia]
MRGTGSMSSGAILSRDGGVRRATRIEVVMADHVCPGLNPVPFDPAAAREWGMAFRKLPATEPRA